MYSRRSMPWAGVLLFNVLWLENIKRMRRQSCDLKSVPKCHSQRKLFMFYHSHINVLKYIGGKIIAFGFKATVIKVICFISFFFIMSNWVVVQNHT